MKPIQTFRELTEHLQALKCRRRIAVVCGHDKNTEYAISRAVDEGFAEL
ncbi:MAG: phosphate butyryltransferase, partial [Prevotellaceae bacterium]|nr:phosphate butyryltransferase [Prevotellaceae bacterium]